jgi:hypothetical protein
MLDTSPSPARLRVRSLVNLVRKPPLRAAVGDQRRAQERNVKPSRLFLGVLLTVATACGDSTGPGGMSGSLSFSHSGATSGTFSASGSILVPDPMAATWAAAVRDDANQTLSVAANVVRPSNILDVVAIDLPRLMTGTFAIPNEARVAINFGQTQSGARTWGCNLTSGSVIVTAFSGVRALGTFSGAGSCLGATGLVAFTVADGSFDVPVVSGIFPAAVRSPSSRSFIKTAGSSAENGRVAFRTTRSPIQKNRSRRKTSRGMLAESRSAFRDDARPIRKARVAFGETWPAPREGSSAKGSDGRRSTALGRHSTRAARRTARLGRRTRRFGQRSIPMSCPSNGATGGSSARDPRSTRRDRGSTGSIHESTGATFASA